MKLPKICGGFLNVTQKCNLKCKYCFVVQQPLEMTYTTAKDAVDFYAQNAVAEAVDPQVTFFGGEPMLKYEEVVKPIVEYIRATYGDYDLSITTNGTLLNEERLRFLKDNDVGLLLSIDGDKETQDFNRPYHSGKGSYDDIDVEMVLKYYPNVTYRGTIDPATVHKMYDNYMWAKAKGFTNSSMILNVFADWDEEHIDILREQTRKIVEKVDMLRKSGLPYMEFNQLYDAGKHDTKLRQIDDNYFRDEGQHLPACGRCGLGGTRFASVGASGNIYSCQEMTENPESKEFIIGNIYTGVDDDARLRISQSFNTKNAKCEDESYCNECAIKRICDGGCTINNFFQTGSLDRLPKIFCIWQNIILEEYRRTKI